MIEVIDLKIGRLSYPTLGLFKSSEPPFSCSEEKGHRQGIPEGLQVSLKVSEQVKPLLWVRR